MYGCDLSVNFTLDDVSVSFTLPLIVGATHCWWKGVAPAKCEAQSIVIYYIEEEKLYAVFLVM